MKCINTLIPDVISCWGVSGRMHNVEAEEEQERENFRGWCNMLKPLATTSLMIQMFRMQTGLLLSLHIYNQSAVLEHHCTSPCLHSACQGLFHRRTYEKENVKSIPKLPES